MQHRRDRGRGTDEQVAARAVRQPGLELIDDEDEEDEDDDDDELAVLGREARGHGRDEVVALVPQHVVEQRGDLALATAEPLAILLGERREIAERGHRGGPRGRRGARA